VVGRSAQKNRTRGAPFNLSQRPLDCADRPANPCRRARKGGGSASHWCEICPPQEVSENSPCQASPTTGNNGILRFENSFKCLKIRARWVENPSTLGGTSPTRL
jgi:hypothetical protein